MQKTWQDIDFTLEKTQDGSPTLRRFQATRPDYDSGESMHHSGGAWQETIYIYKPVMDQVHKMSIERPGFLSIGLGLGYNEMLLAREFAGRQTEMISFETIPELKEFFLSWIEERPLHPEVQSTYEEMARLVFAGEISALKAELRENFLSKRWIIEGAVETAASPGPRFHGILYDAFSKAVSPELWNQAFLEKFLKEWTAPRCAFSTYSCTGDLKRALKSAGFAVDLRLGFKGKRNSTWACRDPIHF